MHTVNSYSFYKSSISVRSVFKAFFHVFSSKPLYIYIYVCEWLSYWGENIPCVQLNSTLFLWRQQSCPAWRRPAASPHTACARWMVTAAKSLCSAAKPRLRRPRSHVQAKLSAVWQPAARSKGGLVLPHLGQWPSAHLHNQRLLLEPAEGTGTCAVSRWSDVVVS